ELGREIADTLGASPSPAIVDIDRISVDPTEFPQPGAKRNRPGIPDRRVGTKYPDVSWRPLLRVGGERPRGNGPRQKFNKFPPCHRLSPRRGLRRAIWRIAVLGFARCIVRHTRRGLPMSALRQKRTCDNAAP